MTNLSTPRRVAIVCQGGGSHTAFTAGALKPLLRDNGRGRYQICALTGTSGGAICAALAWYGLLREANHGWSRERAIALLEAFWRDNATQSLWERVWNDWTVNLLRLSAQGLLPAAKLSPYSPQAELLQQQLKALAPRSEFFDLRQLLEKHLRLDEISQPVRDPRLLIGAVAVLSGHFKAFDSLASEISIDAILASTTLPTLFKAVPIGDDIYWDGLFSQNPPVKQLVVGVEPHEKPDEIWLIRINKEAVGRPPVGVEEIEDRRNSLAGNISLRHELNVIATVSRWLEDGTLRSDRLKPIAIRSMEMSDDLNGQLGAVSKLDRDAAFLARLMADGETQAERFLAEIGP